jgi:hypothetical protein
MSAIDVVGQKRNVRKGTDSIFMPGRREQNHSGLAAWYSQFDPVLLRIEGLVGQDLETQLLGVKGKRLLLVPNRNANELDRFNHSNLLNDISV